LLDGERAIQHAHVGVDAHDQQRRDSPVFQETVDLVPVVRDDVGVFDADSRMLTSPGTVPGTFSRIAAAIRIVDRERRAGEVERLRNGDTWHITNPLAL